MNPNWFLCVAFVLGVGAMFLGVGVGVSVAAKFAKLPSPFGRNRGFLPFSFKDEQEEGIVEEALKELEAEKRREGEFRHEMDLPHVPANDPKGEVPGLGKF